MSLRSILGEYRNAQPEMTKSAEPSPDAKAYRRVMAIAAFDGWSIVGVAAAGSLLSLAFGDLGGLAVGAMVAGAGVMELHGRKRLKRRDAGGMRWLIRAQLFLLTVILVYCVSRLASFDGESAMGNLTPDMAAALKESGLEQADIQPMVHTMFLVLYGSVAVVSAVYQGGMALYYRSRVARVTAAIAAPPVVRVNPPAA
jgi:hypothetical protein